MTYRVFYTSRVMADIATQVDYLRSRHTGEQVIEIWFGKLFDSLDDLYYMPGRYPVDRLESEKRGREIRKFSFGNYIIRYRIDTEHQIVYVLSFIHGARQT